MSAQEQFQETRRVPGLITCGGSEVFACIHTQNHTQTHAKAYEFCMLATSI